MYEEQRENGIVFSAFENNRHHFSSPLCVFIENRQTNKKLLENIEINYVRM